MEKNKVGLLVELLQVVAQEKAQRDLKGTWFQGSHTYLDALADEILEVKTELQLGRKCFLEDELADLLWNIVCLLEHLELEGKVEQKQVFHRALKKYSERVTERLPYDTWNDVKARQKLELEKEYGKQ
ncbi:MazG nucleotide pyrophosphohydrolase domain-containing protein [Shewanella glacialipiscicola]|uniref:MazG nucleotide pyrophosphohydrolase domain-containing protein n=1 Tax=Shewanella glacialipiscicola TaxID=614069 RepID=UPI003D7A831C